MTNLPETSSRRSDIVHLILDERNRQDAMIREAVIDIDCTDPDLSDFHKLAVLAEEFGEVAKALLESPEDLKTELVQTAAVCFAWLEALAER